MPQSSQKVVHDGSTDTYNRKTCCDTQTGYLHTELIMPALGALERRYT